ncbi:MAG: 7-carboxy-7-deazaguanine synthase QueE [Pseudomonadota bacterium]|nr:7-carboxy-7-deazaguanine synthase QueE [Burkholderiales bacterium]MDQ3196445.1 7-carboxy-7-deazaguanine synthase QueE [Pseudomonadota bacterium]
MEALEKFHPLEAAFHSDARSLLSLPLRITEIFHSLQGETSRTGLPTVFIRLTGCPLRCAWCDTEYAFYGGETLPISAVLEQIRSHQTHFITVTGGEPLAQKNCLPLLRVLSDEGYSISLETSGALDIAAVDARVSKIVDIKTPGSGECAKNRWDNLAHLNRHDEIKFVLSDEADYAWARQILRERALADICPVLFAPVWKTLAPATLAEWILHDRLPVRMQLQLHKILWGEKRGV